MGSRLGSSGFCTNYMYVVYILVFFSDVLTNLGLFFLVVFDFWTVVWGSKKSYCYRST